MQDDWQDIFRRHRVKRRNEYRLPRFAIGHPVVWLEEHVSGERRGQIDAHLGYIVKNGRDMDGVYAEVEFENPHPVEGTRARINRSQLYDPVDLGYHPFGDKA